MSRRRSELVGEWAACIAVSILATCIVAQCKAQTTVGLHVATAHFEGNGHSDTPGLYVKLPFGVAGGRVMLGGYHNSLNSPERRTSYYVAQAWEFGRYSVVLGVVSGYQRQVYEGQAHCPPGRYHTPEVPCAQEWGHTRGALGPMGAVSVAWPEVQPVLGFAPRLSLMPKGVHFSLERQL